MHRLIATYSRAVEQELVEQHFPFKRVKTSIEKTVKKAILVKFIRKLKSLDLSDSPSKAFARDMFLFSFYTRGMSFIDIAYLQKIYLASLGNSVADKVNRKILKLV